MLYQYIWVKFTSGENDHACRSQGLGGLYVGPASLAYKQML